MENKPSKKSKLSKTHVVIIVVVTVLILVTCMCGLLVPNISKDVPISGAVKVEIPTNTPHQEYPTETVQPTPKPMLGMDLTQFIAKYDNLTDIQKEEFISSSTGRWVDWDGEVRDVESDGTILIRIPGTLVSTVSLKGVSEETAINISKGQSVHFSGQVSNIVDIIGLYVYLVDVEILP